MALIILIPLIMNDWEGLEHRLKQIYESVKSLPDEESEVPAFQVHEQGRSEENEEEKDPVNVLKGVGEVGKGFVRSIYLLKSPRLRN